MNDSQAKLRTKIESLYRHREFWIKKVEEIEEEIRMMQGFCPHPEDEIEHHSRIVAEDNEYDICKVCKKVI